MLVKGTPTPQRVFTSSDVQHWWKKSITWWRHQMEAFSALLAICAENSPVTGEFPAQSQWHKALMFSLICVSINGWVNNGEAGDLRRNRAHYSVTVIQFACNRRNTGKIKAPMIFLIHYFPAEWNPDFYLIKTQNAFNADNYLNEHLCVWKIYTIWLYFPCTCYVISNLISKKIR